MRFQIISPGEVEKLSSRGAVVIDVRSREEYASGHFRGAKNIPEPEGGELAALLNRKRSYIFYCEHGGRSTELARELGNMGYIVATVAGGWRKMQKIVS